ncbi:MAG: HAD-IA family hydrolase [Geminicoccaceae bacterium]
MSRLVVFDCDGTLVDSQQLIVRAMGGAFREHGLEAPPAGAVRALVGLSLTEAIGRLQPGVAATECLAIAASYQAAWRAIRASDGITEPLFPGAREALVELDRRGHLLGVATGKGRGGLLIVLEHHGLERLFVTLQTADRHPSKPHPAMLEEALRETGSRPEDTLMVGDTTFDVEMALAAGVRPIGVAWGYHPAEALWHAGAEVVLSGFGELVDLVEEHAA